MASELESDLRNAVEWGRKCLLISMLEKTQLVLLDRPNNTGAIDVKIDGFVLDENSSFKMLGLTLSSKLDRDSYIMSFAKTSSKKVGGLLRSFYEVSFS